MPISEKTPEETKHDRIMAEKDARIAQLETELLFAQTQLEAFLDMQPPAEDGMLKRRLMERKSQNDARAFARREAFEEAAKCCDDEADLCDDAIRWGEGKRYVADCKAASYAICKAASYAIRDRAAAIRLMAKKG